MRTARALVLFAAIGLAACSGGKTIDPFRRAMAEGDRAMSAGLHAEASKRYDEAAKQAARPRDRDLAEYSAALALSRTDQTAAIARLDAIARAEPPGPHAAEAAYRAADLRLKSGATERGWAAMEEVVVRFPNSGVARPALRRVVAHKDETGSGLAYLNALAPRVDATELAQNVAYARAAHLAEAGEIAAARDAYVALADRWPYPFGSLWDDALYRASEMEEKLGRYHEAIALLERMLKEREPSTAMGSYERPKYTPALMRIARLYEERLNDKERARAAYHRLYAEFAHSPLRDDALWREAQLFRAEGKDDAACDRLRTLVGDFPDSRYVPCIVERCPRVTRPEKSKAPATCRPYIVRERTNEGTTGRWNDGTTD
jgi:tetratricopeptide (TPR) repeat protein